MDFRETLEFLYGLQRFGIKLGLENTRALLERAGHPERNFLVVQVAGTNGKGSVCAMLAEILQAAGHRVGLYTSPHLQSFTERIRINGVALTEEEVVSLTAELRTSADGIPATFFEFTTVLALTAFSLHQVEIAILETGLGGRLDATTATNPSVTVITPLSLDHQEYLGPDLAAIAAEKAGIIKPATPLIIGRQPPEALKILLQSAQECEAPVFLLDFNFFTEPAADGFTFRSHEVALPDLRPGLNGRHQFDNAAVAVQAALLLRQKGMVVPDEAIRSGITKVQWPGRLEWWGSERTLLLDGAHNAAGALVLADYLKTLSIAGIHWVVGIKEDKLYRAILAPILPISSALYAVTPPTVPAITPEQLVTEAVHHNVPACAFANVAEALAAAQAARQPDEIILVAGSLFLVGAVRQLLETEECPA